MKMGDWRYKTIDKLTKEEERMLRTELNKPMTADDELLALTKEAKEAGVNVCWYLVDSDIDTQETRLATYDLIKTGNPFRLNVEHGIRQ